MTNTAEFTKHCSVFIPVSIPGYPQKWYSLGIYTAGRAILYILISPYTHQSPRLFQNALKLLFFGILLVGAFFGNANNSSEHVNSVSVFNQGILGSP